MSQDDDDLDFDQTLTGMLALGQSEHGDARMLLKTARGIEGLKDKQAAHATRLALLEDKMIEVKVACQHDRVARIAKTEVSGVIKDVNRIEKWLYAVAAAVGLEGLHVIAQMLTAKSS
jgi:hypothetical protein